MRIMKIAVMLMAVACVPFLSHAAEVQVTSSTQYSWYEDFLSNDKDQNEVTEYLRMNLTKLDNGNKISVYGYGRVIKQISTSFEERPEIASDLYGRMYYLYLDYKDVVKDHLDFKAGRTYVHATAVSGTIDGIYLNARNLGPVGVTLFGGRHVIFDNKSEIGTGQDTISGASVYLDTVKYTHVEVGYGRKYSESDLAQENVGLDFSTTPHEKVNIYGRYKYDIVSSKANEYLLGAKVAPIKELILRGEYYNSRPTFDKFSFYRFFNVNNYKEISIEAEVLITGDYRVSARYANENFGDGANADLYNVGFFARPIKDLILSASYEKRNGFTGALNGIRFQGEYRIKKAAISAGIDYDDFKRDTARDDSAKRYWAGFNYEITKMFSASAKLEDDVNYRADSSYKGFVAVNVNL